MNEQEPIGYSRFFRWLDGKCAPVTESLETLSGYRIDDDRTPMIERASLAWTTPVDRLSCEQARLLISQKMGLEWLAVPVTTFVRAYPKAWVTFYSGDFSFAALRAFPQLLEVAPSDARAMMDADFDWLVDEMKNDPHRARDVRDTITNARTLARGHS